MSPGRIALPILAAIAPIVHGDQAVQQHEHFLAVIHVPDIGLVGPVQADGRAFDLGKRQRIPGLAGDEVAGGYELHGGGLAPRQDGLYRHSVADRPAL
jgi:hypothetical protein